MKKFIINIDGREFAGVFEDSMDATIWALESYPDATRVTVKRAPKCST